jgi:probable rRNA maturation factor
LRRRPLVTLYVRAPQREGLAARWLRRDLRAFLGLLGVGPADLSLTLTDDRGIAALNRRHRSIDGPTDVLSFPQSEVPGSRRTLGDLVISVQTARREAAARRIPLREELRRYAAHGLLHLLGEDHHERREAARMERLERQLLKGEGLIAAASNRDMESTVGRERRRRRAR